MQAKHYAKGMCNRCYHIYGRKKLATQCEHRDKMDYAKGLCQKCYYKIYNSQIKMKRQELRGYNPLAELPT